MKILYTTDLHGSDMFYAIIRKRALENNVDMIINGGDMLPKRGHNIFEAQEKFIRTLEKRHFKMIEKHRIPYLCCLGNDDMRIYDQAFDEVCSKFEFVHNIAGRKVEIGGFEFIGFNLITDYQFQMKDRCRMDTRDFKFAKQNGVGSFTTENGWEDIGKTVEDWFELARTLPTIEEELNALPKPKDPRKTIYVTHMPPAGVGLDGSQDRPVSKAVFEFIKNSNALLSLHGHIHDSFKVTRIWNAQVGNTRAIQPGQYGSIPVYCIIDITPSGSQEIKIEMERFAHPGDRSFDKNPGRCCCAGFGQLKQMKILYTTDLHGYDQYYSDTRKKALENNVDIVINGGDMLPKTGNRKIFKIQKDFIRHLEQQYFPLFEKDRIHYLCSLGNDDLRIYDQAFDEACSKFEFVHNIAGRKIEIGGYEFIGFNLVTDYPFQLKDRCRMDKKDYSFQMQFGPGFYSSEKLTWEKIEDWFELAKSLPTIEEELKTLPKTKDPRKTIYVIHMPPAGYDLDTCRSGERPNSMAVKEFIENSDALLSLHGHVHESFKMTGIWNARVGDTIAIQPGQDWSRLVYCLIDIAPFGSQAVKIEMNRHAHPGDMLFDKSPGMVIVSAAKEKEFFIGKYKNEHR